MPLNENKKFSELHEYAYKLSLAGIDKENALKQVLAYAKKYKGSKDMSQKL